MFASKCHWVIINYEFLQGMCRTAITEFRMFSYYRIQALITLKLYIYNQLLNLIL